MRSRVFSLSLGIVLSLAPLVHAQKPAVEVVLDEVVDNRVSAGQWNGTLELRVRLKGGSVLEKADAARVLVKDARDDKGNVLSDGSRVPDFMGREYNSGMLQVSLGAPARAAGSVKVKGTVELFVPTRDPSSIVTIDKALSKLDTPLNSKVLKTAKVSLTPLSPDGYRKVKEESHKLDAAKIAELRAEGRKHGVSDAEIEMAIEMAKAFDVMDRDLPEYTVILSGTKADFDRVFRIEILGADGKPMSLPSRSTSTRGDSSLMTLQPSEPPPPNAALQIFLLTDKSRVTAPFEMTVSLP